MKRIAFAAVMIALVFTVSSGFSYAQQGSASGQGMMGQGDGARAEQLAQVAGIALGWTVAIVMDQPVNHPTTRGGNR